MKIQPRLKEEDRDKILKLDMQDYVDDYLKRRKSKNGYIMLSQVNFKNIVNKA